MSRKTTGRVVVFAAGTTLVTAALFAVAAVAAEDDYSFDRRGGQWPSPSDPQNRSSKR